MPPSASKGSSGIFREGRKIFRCRRAKGRGAFDPPAVIRLPEGVGTKGVPPKSTPKGAAARLSDLVLVTSLGDVFDMETLPTVRNLLRAGGDPPAFILYNAIHPQGSKIADQLKAMTADYCGLPACPVHLTRRATHSEAALQGKAVHEIEPQGKAAAELERLYLFIKEQEKAKHGEERNRTGKRA